MPRGWKSLLRACLREAERGETAARIAYKAMRADVKRDVSPEFLGRLRQMAESNQPNLPGFGSAGVEFAAGVAATPHERCVAQHAQRLHANGVGGRDLMQRALSEGLADMRTQQLRQAEQHVYLDGGRGAQAVMAAVRTACDGVAEQLAAECCGTAPKRTTTSTRTRIDPDEDLAIHP
jgi:hypothetical protein